MQYYMMIQYPVHFVVLAALALALAQAVVLPSPLVAAAPSPSPPTSNHHDWFFKSQSHDQHKLHTGRPQVQDHGKRVHVPFVPNAARHIADHVRQQQRFLTTADDHDKPPSFPPPPVFQSRDQYRVSSLPGIDLPSPGSEGGGGGDGEYTLYAGHLRVDNLNSTQFFMYYELPSKPKDLIVWLNGGPGSSSLFGHFVENGPLLVNFTTGQLVHNPHGWHKANANVLWLENPASVGFSYVASDANVVKTNDDVGQQFVRFAREFSLVFGTHFHWWITGESFAGMYIPYMAKHVLAHNAQHPHALVRLHGVAIGNGAFNSPYSEPVNWVDYLDAEGLLLHPGARADLIRHRNTCFQALMARDPHVPQSHFPSCVAIADTLFNQSRLLHLTNNTHCLPSTFDIRVRECNKGDPTDVPAQFTGDYLSLAHVARALHAVPAAAPARNWTSFSPQVYANLNENADPPSADLLPGLIRAGVRVLLYNGDRDFICNYKGTENMLDAYLAWGAPGESVQVGFGPQAWQPLAGGFGVFKRARGLAYVRVLQAGHMVPFNLPSGSLQMVKAFLAGEL